MISLLVANTSKSRSANPLSVDPSRTTMLRASFAREMQARVNRLKSSLWGLVVTEDAFGLKPHKPFQITFNRFQFQTDDEKLKSFNRWFANQVNKDILQVDHEGKPWTAKYVDSAYKKGRVRAYLDSHKQDYSKPEAWLAGSRDQFLRSAFMQPETVSKLRLLGTRNFEQLKGISADMSAKLNHVLAIGIAGGMPPAKIAMAISKEIDGINRRRALVLARTEIIHAHAEGQLDSFEELGIDQLNIYAEWGTAGDKRVCPRCNAMSGMVFTVAKARGLIPLHPLCRCSWRPAMGVRASRLGKKQLKALGGPLPVLKETPPEPAKPAPPSRSVSKAKQIQASVRKDHGIELLIDDLESERSTKAAQVVSKQLGYLDHVLKRPSKPPVIVLPSADGPDAYYRAKQRQIYLPTESKLPLTDKRPVLGKDRVAADLGTAFRQGYGRYVWHTVLTPQERTVFKNKVERYIGQRKSKISTLAASSVKDFWAEAFAVLTSPKYLRGMLPAKVERALRGLIE